MFTPSQAIAHLDGALLKAGQALKLKRGGGEPHDVRGFVRGFKPSELIGVLKQGDRSVTLSPSALVAFGVPRAMDKVVIGDSSATVQSVEPVRLNDVLVRINLVVRGE